MRVGLKHGKIRHRNIHHKISVQNCKVSSDPPSAFTKAMLRVYLATGSVTLGCVHFSTCAAK